MLKTKVCVMCNEEYTPTGPAQKVCANCRKAFEKKQAHDKYVARYKKKGYNQKGENNNSYKNGIGYFRRKALEHYGEACMRCESVQNICVHHKDTDRTNNAIENLEVLCKSCHQKEHEAASHLNTLEGRQKSSEAARIYALSRTDLERDNLGRFKTK